jgi:tyrosinase
MQAASAARIIQLQSHYQHNLLAALGNRSKTTGCTSKSIRRRAEWSTLTTTARTSFIAALYCLNALPPRTPAAVAAGARTRYDDLIVLHILQTPRVHASGLFLPFHRHFLHQFETALRSECRYDGPLPYWDSTASFPDPRAAGIFSGGEAAATNSSSSSMGSNGRLVPGRKPTAIKLPGGITKMIPPATGGGCVESGPFAEGKWEIRLGPVGYEPQGPEGGLGYNPRCLTRDLSPEFSWGTRPSVFVDLVDGCDTLGCVVQEMDAPGGVPGGLHASGHWQVGLNALDVYASPSDPIFWLHHAQVDRVWSIWQGQDLERRTYEVWGTSTAANDPPSDNVTLDTVMDFGYVGPPRTIEDVSSTIDGEYCYMYE